MQLLHSIANVLGFSLTPLVALSMAFLYDEKLRKHGYKLAIPVYFQVIMCALSPWTGWIFFVSVANEYTRGPLFFLNVAIDLYCFIILIYANTRSSRDYDKNERIFLAFLYLLILFGNVIQIIFPNILLIWSCVSVSILLYYIFLRELQFKFDPLTGIRNRFSFQKKMLEMQELDTVAIAVFDLNNLKDINDTLGHLEGDKYIVDSATIINNSFQDIGITYRIGGDEFCVLCKQVEESKMKAAFKMLESLSTNQYTNDSYPRTIAYGYEVYKKADTKNIYDTFAKADIAMYAHKMLMKSNEKQSKTMKRNEEQ
jgi:diguanylate cyclase (GGDEF)-like protein